MDIPIQYIDLLRNRLLQQADVYYAFKSNRCSSVSYKSYTDKTYGVRDENDTNRLRLSYYLLFEKIDDEEIIAALFEEELKDRQTNSFQGIGTTLKILTQLLRKYNGEGKYTSLFQKAKKANFDCFCGYDENAEIDDNIGNNSLIDCIFLAQDMNYKDIMEELVEEWKQTVPEWNNVNCKTLIRFNRFLNKEAENEEIYKRLLVSADSKKVFDIASAYKDMIGYYIEIRDYKTAYKYFRQLANEYNLDEIKDIRLFAYFLEYGMDIIVNVPDLSAELWSWIKPELQNRKHMFGNLYTKGIAAAKALHDPYAVQLEAEYVKWKDSVGMK